MVLNPPPISSCKSAIMRFRSSITALISEETASLRDYAISFKQDSSIMLSKNAIQKKFSASCVKFLENTFR